MNSTLRAWNDFLTSTGYDHRETQDDLVELITETLEERGYLLGRAGTGTGKSLASVIPSLAFAQSGRSRLDGPVIVTTATKALQGQYYLKDLPFMAKHYKVPRSNDPLSPTHGKTQMKFSILKGKRNYLCLDRLQMPAERIEPSILTRLKNLKPEHEGDVATLGLNRSQELALTISTDDCPGAMDCIAHAMASADDPGKGCYYERAKKRAGESDVLVINHALLASHVKILAATEGKIALLPSWSVLVADECHKLTGYIQNALGWHMSLIRLFKWANACLNGQELEDFKEAAKKFFHEVVTYDPADKKNEQQIQERDSLKSSYLELIFDTVEGALEEWMITASETRTNEDRRKARQCANLLADLEVALTPDNRDNFWVELDKQGNKILYYKPAEKKCAEFMEEHLWPTSPAILLSATTPTAASLGLPKSTHEFEADSPFDYATQSRLYISSLDGAPPYNADRYERELWEQNRHKEMLQLVASSDGRALLLFTSWADLNKAHDAIAPRLRQAGVTILKQDRDNQSERDRLAREFKEDERSVLFGTESFFEGIDIPGRSLQLVIISKMPFPAMIDNTRGGKLDFKNEMLPEMRMKVIQAAGRLIRSHDDRGLVAILDSRMTKKPYGKNIIANISPFNEMTQVRSLADAMAYLESLEEA